MADSKKDTSVVTHSGQLFQALAQDRGVDVFLSLLETPATGSDLARRLGITRAKVNYLLDCLLQEELIYLHSQTRNGSHLQTCYAAKTDFFHLMKENIMRSIQTEEATHLGVVHDPVSKERVQEYVRRLQELQEEFEHKGE